MRRTLAVLMAVAATWALPGGAVAAPADVASGRGLQEIDTGVFEEFRFAARSGPLGEDPSGRMFIRRSDDAFLLEAEVNCLQVFEHQATLVGEVTRNEGAFDQPGFEALVFIVNDNRGLGMPDTFVRIVTTEPLAQADCFPTTAFLPIDRGNIIVHDA
jgi:hypothetical protein